MIIDNEQLDMSIQLIIFQTRNFNL